MFRTQNNEIIGKYLEDLVRKSEYKKDRPFCKEYLVRRDGNPDPAPEDIQKMQNRFCQIKQGKKGVQITDLPIFSELLRVSIEDILSAGTALVPVQNRITNYSVAFSKDPAEWQAYVEREDKLILNPDEYDKTVIDYALEAGNYPFLKYLTEKGYIWFVGNDRKEYFINCFGAGTSIPKRETQFRSDLDYRLNAQDDLRFKMIALAIRNKDYAMLDKLHAREIPLLYNLTPLGHGYINDEAHLPTPNVEQMIESIAASENRVLAYFFDEYELDAEKDVFRNTYVFPYAGRVLDALIKANRVNESKRFLEKAIEHNEKVWKNLQSLADKSKASCKEFCDASYGPDYDSDAAVREEVWRYYYFYPENGFVAYCMPFFIKNAVGFITNVINVTEASKNEEVQCLIDELKKSYNCFSKLLENKEK